MSITLQKIYPAAAGFFVMAFYVYILHSPSLDQYYIGHTENLKDRLFRHKNSGSKSTKKANDWVISYTKDFASRPEAMHRELEIKNKKSRKYIEWLISSPDNYREVRASRMPAWMNSRTGFREDRPALSGIPSTNPCCFYSTGFFTN